MEVALQLAVLLILTGLNLAQHCEKNNGYSWSYHGSTNGPKKWKGLFPACDENPSPIGLLMDKIENAKNLTKLVFLGYEQPILRGEVENDGRTVSVQPLDKMRRGIILEGKEYNLEYVQFHFGSIEKPGSEHTVNHIRYPMEVQFVHKNARNEYAAVALLVDISNHMRIVKHQAIVFRELMTSVYTHMENNPAFDPIIEVLPLAAFKDEHPKLRSPLFLSAFLPQNPASFYRYSGSLTTPPCNKATWAILKTATVIGPQQLDFFQRLFTVRYEEAAPECLMSENYRPVESTRDVFASQ